MTGSRTMGDWTRWARLPWDMFAAGMDFMYKASMPPGYEDRLCSSATGGSTSSSWLSGFGSSSSDCESNGGSGVKDHRESNTNSPVHDDVLGGNDVKLVRSRLMFTKPGHEKILNTWEDMIDYSTNAESFAGLKLARYIGTATELSEDDHRFLRVHIEVIDRFPRENVDYEARRLDLLEEQVELLRAQRARQGNGNERLVA